MDDVALDGTTMPRDRLLFSLCFASSLVMLPRTGLAAEDVTVRPKVAVVNAVDLPERMEATRTQLRQALEDAVQKRGLDLIRPAVPTSCSDASCLPDFAKATGATAVLTARGGRNGSYGYHVEVSLWNAATGEVAPAVADCSVCSGPQMVDSVVKAVGPLLDGVRSARASALPPGPPPVVPPVPPPIVGIPTNPQGSATLPVHRGHPVLGWSLVAGGGLAAVAGGLAWSVDGKGTDCVGSSCKSTYRTEGEGIALLAVGLVGVGAGLWVALDPFGGRDLAMVVGPSGAVLAGRF